MYYQPTPISWQDYHFLIMSAPDDQSMGKCIKDLKLNNVKLVIRTCEQSYNEDPLKEANIDIKVCNHLYSLLLHRSCNFPTANCQARRL